MRPTRPSMQELIGRRRRAGFVGRSDERAAFRENLDLPAEDERHRFLFHVHGNAGVGKTFLVRELEQLARDRGALTAYVDEGCGSVPEAMSAICQQLAAQGHRLKKLEEALTAHRERRHEAEAEVAALEPAPEGPSPVAATAVRLGLAGLGMAVPVAGPFMGAVDSDRLAEGAARLKARLSARFRNQEDLQLVLAPERVLTPKFLDELADVTSAAPWLVLFFDTYERTGAFLDGWLHDLMTTDRYGELPAEVVVVTSGQRPFDTGRWGGFADFMTDLPLGPFTEAEARGLLADRGVRAEPVVAEVLRLSGGLPVLVSTLAESRPADPDDVGDLSATAVERFLRWEPDPARRRVAVECALPRFLDADVFRAAVDCADEEALALYDWLRGMPFVSERGDRAQYHDVVRAPMLRLERRRSPRGWAERHERLARTFAGWREEREGELRDAWDDRRWRELRLAEAYHRLCAREQVALPGVLRDVVLACARGPEEARRWGRMLAEAGEDTQATAVARWGRDLLDALEDANTEAALGLLIDRADLDAGLRAVAHATRGRILRTDGRYERAMLEYDRAIALDGELASAYFGRGSVRAHLGDYAAAVEDLDRAHALDPEGAEILAVRGDYHRILGDHEAALRDLDRAVELDRTRPTAWAARGVVQHALGQTDLALADLEQALVLAPDFVWALVRRARVRRSRGEREPQLADLDRAVALAPDTAWILCERGDALSAAGREEEALADYQRAIDLDDTYASVYASRGALHAQHERYEDAVADLDRALELFPEYLWALVHRSRALCRLGRFEAALADAHRAVELDPADGWALANRITMSLAVGRLERARSDLDRYRTIGSDLAWACRKMAQLHVWGGRFEEALAELDDDDTRCEVHLRTGDWGLARQEAERLCLLDEFDGALNLALAASGETGVTAARPLWRRYARSARGSAAYRRVSDIVEAVICAGLQDWVELDARLERVLATRHEWTDLAGLSDCLDILLQSDGIDRSRLAPRRDTVVAARDAMRARYAE
ncbi:tetratricopeptide repeat protein [Streptomyces sp. NPDC002779]|uniref:tetratricopeptide repeat protein n=1 Tax=Streptomyces sp. NPDC002779 TaxID=3364664 RepID=UPI0036C421F2